MQGAVKRITFGATLLVSLNLWAQTSGDWVRAEVTDANWGITTCVASTQSPSQAVTAKLEMIFAKDNSKLPLLALKVVGSQSADASAQVTSNGGEIYQLPLLKAADESTPESIYIVSPADQRAFTKVVMARSKLTVTLSSAIANETMILSLKGSSDTLNRTAACRQAKTLFNDKVMAIFEANAATEPQQGPADELVQAAQFALEDYTAAQVADQALVQLRKNNTSLIAKETNALTAQKTALAREQAVQNKVASLESSIAKLQSDLANAEITRQRLLQERATAAQDYNVKEANLAPLRERVNAYQKSIDSAEQRLAAVKSEIQSASNEAQSARQQLSSVQNEANNLSLNLQNIGPQINEAQQNWSHLDQMVNRFDLNRRQQEILRNNNAYQIALRDIRILREEVEANRRRVSEADRRIRMTQDALRSCQISGPLMPNQPQACSSSNYLSTRPDVVNSSQYGVKACDHYQRFGKNEGMCNPCGNPVGCTAVDYANQRPDVASDSHYGAKACAHFRSSGKNEGMCNPCGDAPERDCRSQARDVEVATQEGNRAERELQNSEERARYAQNTIHSSEREAADYARRELDELVNKREAWATQVRTLRQSSKSMQARLRQIADFDVPNLHRRIANADGRLAQLNQDNSTALANLSSTKADLANYKAAVRYNEVLRLRDEARSLVASLDLQIDEVQKLQATGPKTLAAQQKDLEKQKIDLIKLTAERVAADTALTTIQSSLAGFKEEEAKLIQTRDAKLQNSAVLAVRAQGIANYLKAL